MELIFAIADYLDIPNEFVFIDKVSGDLVWFHLSTGRSLYWQHFTCKTVRGGKFLKKNSIRGECND